MRTHRLILPVLCCLLAPRLMRSQQPTLPPERQAAMMEAGRLANTPAEFVLHYRKELALTGSQVTSIEQLAAALRDSAAARTARMSREVQTNATSTGFTNAMEWSGPIDEAAIRDASRRQSAATAETMIAIARDRRAVGALLTPNQRAQLPQLQRQQMSKAILGNAR